MASTIRRPRFEIAASILLALVCAPSSLVGVPGLESAVVFGVILPPIFAAAYACRGSRARAEHEAVDTDSHAPIASSPVASAILAPTFAMLCIAVIQLARHLVDPACASFAGLPRLLLGPWPGMVLAALVGELVGRLVDRPRRALGLALLVVFASYGVVVYEVVSTPAVFVFSIFGGHWPGPIYDDDVGVPMRLLTYRGVTVLAIASLALALRFVGGSHAERGLRRIGLVLAAVFAIGFVVFTIRGASLGHRTSTAHIDATLGAIERGERCVLHLPSEIPAYERRRTLAECETHVRGVERILGVHRRERLHAYIYRSAVEKGELVGAAETYVAKPWRGEVHVQREGFPHEVLRHEIVHVLAAELADAPFRVSGRLGGLWMNPGLVEGLAVAAGEAGPDGLSADQWSRAMLELDRLPSVSALMGAGFLGQGANASYQAAGSFVGHLLRMRGASSVGRMYRRGSVGDDAALARYERSWHAYLRTVTLPSSALELARTRLLDRGLFSTRCARLRERLAQELAEARGRFADGRALRICRKLVGIDANDAGARIAEVQTLARAGRFDDAERALTQVDSARLAPAMLLARAHQTLGDAIIARASDADEAAFARARVHYETALAVPQDEPSARSLEVRILALRFMPGPRRVVLDAIAERGRAAHAETNIVASLLAVDDSSARAIARYIAARRLLDGPQDGQATALLEEARRLGLPTERLRRETDRLLALETSRTAFENVRNEAARVEAIRRWTELGGDPLAAGEANRMLAMLAALRP